MPPPYFLLLFALLIVGCSPKLAVEPDADDNAVAPSQPTQQGPIATLGIGEVYGEDIETVQFRIDGLELTNPIVELGGRADLLLSFDVLDENVREFRYDLTHCNANWEPSQLTPIDYLRNFTEGEIRDYNLSFNALTAYTSYRLLLPNQYVAWTKSGNYLLNVYDDDSGELVMRLRFCVVEPLVNLDIVQTRPGRVALDRTHQEFDLSLNLRDTRLENPRRTLTITAIQNGDWRTGIYNVPPRFVRDGALIWDYQNRLQWPAHREWRTLDLRTLETEGGRVKEIVQEGNDFKIYLTADGSRANFPAETRIDLNGKFVIEDFDNRMLAQEEYGQTLFTLKMPRNELLEPLYLYGALTHYKLSEANQGVWNPLTNSYVFTTKLKQGFYNYAYVSTDAEGQRPDWTETEGNFFQTENEYQFLLYYRPYGERYDRIIGYQNIQINR